MSSKNPTSTPLWPSALALGASILGFSFALSSTLDYTRHLDRQVHDLHCSFVPGLGADAGQESACRAAMYSPYSALFKDKYWGGVPISLFALGAFGFFAAFSVYLLLARDRAPRRAHQFLFLTGITPLLVSAVMFVISLTKIGAFCKTCVGIYSSSLLLAIAGIASLVYDTRRARDALEVFRLGKKPAPAPIRAAADLEKVEDPDAPLKVNPTLKEGEVPAIEAPPREPRIDTGASGRASAPYAPDPEYTPPRTGGPLLIPAWLVGLGVFSLIPAALYVSAMPDYATYVAGCGKLDKPADTNKVLLHITPAGARQQATMVVDPLCPTCKAFHQRLMADGILDKLDITLVLFPLDNDCNWMLDRALHPGACIVSKAVLCSDHKAQNVLEWSYEHQEELLKAAKGNPGINEVRAMIRERWPGLDACMDSKETKQRLEQILRWAVNNQLPVSTPQLFLDGTRLCDEDSDIGLSYTISKLAPDVKR